MNNMEHPVTLITGTSRGVGKELALYYCNHGHKVIGCSRGVCDISHENYMHITADISKEEDILNIFKLIRLQYKRLDNLINNAAIASINTSLLTPYSVADDISKINFLAAFMFSREASKIMMKKNFGRIINISSVDIQLKVDGNALYAAAKSAVETYSRVLAKEVSTYGITVNTIALTPIKTSLLENIVEEKIYMVIDMLTIKRFAEISDITNLIDFLMKKESNYITSQVIALGGV